MSIVQSIDAEEKAIEQEINDLEAQLQPLRSRLEGVQDLRQRAEALPNAEGGGLPDTATPPRPKPAKAPKKAETPAAEGLSPAAEKVLKAIDAGDGLRSGEIRSATSLSHDQVRRALLELRAGKRIRLKGARAATRYFPKGAADRPKNAPTRERRAAPAPAPEPESRRQDAEPPPPLPPDSLAKQAHNAMREKVAQAIVELVADSEPITGDEITTMVLEQVPEAERSDVTAVRTRLCRAPECKLDQRADGFHLARASSTGRTVTNAEREAVDCLGSGRTAREVASNCDSIRDATSARAILEGLVRRNVVGRRPGSDPAVYEALEAEVPANA